MNFLKFFSNQDKIQYLLLIAFIWIFLTYTIKDDFNLNFVIRFLLLGIITYFILNISLSNKKQSENNLSDKLKLLRNFSLKLVDNKEIAYSSENPTNCLLLENMENDNEAILFFSKYLEFRNIVNYRAFNQSMLHYDKFLKIKNNLLNDTTLNNYKQIYDLLVFEKNNCLNEFASLNISFETKQIKINWDNLIDSNNKKIENALNELETLFKNHFDKIDFFLEKKYFNEPITQNSYPKLYEDDKLSGNIEKTKNYLENFTLYY